MTDLTERLLTALRRVSANARFAWLGRDDCIAVREALGAATALETLMLENAQMREALTAIAEGNLGDWPWQADYNRIRQIARKALGGGDE